ncbi:hypothetical protein CWC16_12105 [Pseudoalteromonas sp. S3776]|uniref:hypothetical protein n=1 Tax=Pseudoalteromonas sp. S3776 TaxID=579544 RepID=UPI001108706E|nr:hypothetical protein [Pseudoalteromonas sp. S3776]TMO79561.1 hypothetical protein CWC16_12105 [Pseudoalteromonas sp. S3776]
MQTLVKYLCYLSGLLFSLLIAGSSNHLSSNGFWHVLNTKADPLQSYWQFPRYFSNNIAHLPRLTLGFLARENIPSAQYNYSLKLIKKNKNEQAKLFWLQSITYITHAQRQDLANLLLARSRWDDLLLLKQQELLPKGDAYNHLALHTSNHYKRIPNAFLKNLGFTALNTLPASNSTCIYNVVMIGVHREGLYKLQSFTKQFNKVPEPQKGVFCFSEPVYAAGALECKNTLSMANCKWKNKALKAKVAKEFGYSVIMSKNGTANVMGKQMQLSTSANYHVFLHELMHFSGFEDEYTLPQSKQKWLCSKQGYVAPNLYISQGEPPPTGWHKSESCQQGGVAYKPSKDWSIMQYQQLGLSKRYRALWQKQIQQQETLTLD